MTNLGATVVLRPGDVLVIATVATASDADIAQLREQTAEFLPGVKLVLIENCTGLAAFRPDKAG